MTGHLPGRLRGPSFWQKVALGRWHWGGKGGHHFHGLLSEQQMFDVVLSSTTKAKQTRIVGMVCDSLE